jgi:hypothetical protein
MATGMGLTTQNSHSKGIALKKGETVSTKSITVMKTFESHAPNLRRQTSDALVPTSPSKAKATSFRDAEMPPTSLRAAQQQVQKGTVMSQIAAKPIGTLAMMFVQFVLGIISVGVLCRLCSCFVPMIYNISPYANFEISTIFSRFEGLFDVVCGGWC